MKKEKQKKRALVKNVKKRKKEAASYKKIEMVLHHQGKKRREEKDCARLLLEKEFVDQESAEFEESIQEFKSRIIESAKSQGIHSRMRFKNSSKNETFLEEILNS